MYTGCKVLWKLSEQASKSLVKDGWNKYLCFIAEDLPSCPSIPCFYHSCCLYAHISFFCYCQASIFFTDLRKSVHPVDRRRKWVCCSSSARKENCNKDKTYNKFSPVSFIFFSFCFSGLGFMHGWSKPLPLATLISLLIHICGSVFQRHVFVNSFFLFYTQVV